MLMLIRASNLEFRMGCRGANADSLVEPLVGSLNAMWGPVPTKLSDMGSAIKVLVELGNSLALLDHSAFFGQLLPRELSLKCLAFLKNLQEPPRTFKVQTSRHGILDLPLGGLSLLFQSNFPLTGAIFFFNSRYFLLLWFKKIVPYE